MGGGYIPPIPPPWIRHWAQGYNVTLNPRTDRKKLSKALTRMPHSKVAQNRDPCPWKKGVGPLTKITNGRVDYALLRKELCENGIIWPPNRNITSPLYSFCLPVGKKIANYYWRHCLPQKDNHYLMNLKGVISVEMHSHLSFLNSFSEKDLVSSSTHIFSTKSSMSCKYLYIRLISNYCFDKP